MHLDMRVWCWAISNRFSDKNELNVDRPWHPSTYWEKENIVKGGNFK